MTTLRVEPTVDEIRRVALNKFSTHGYAATSIRDIANEVGIKGASMYAHFSSKEEILWDLTKSAFDALNASWAAADQRLRTADPLDRLAGFVRAHVRYHAEQHRNARIINAEFARLSPPHYQQVVAKRAAYADCLRTLLRACVESGHASVVDEKLTTFAILQMGMAVADWYDEAGALSIQQISDVQAQLALKMIALEPSPDDLNAAASS